MAFQEYEEFHLPRLSAEVAARWREEGTFEKSMAQREGCAEFIFYEGPPSANGVPGIHHVLARAIKDTICRFKTQCGYHVARKAGWDTHGLPVELGVEQTLGITKEDIGRTVTVEQYNATCREEVMRYTDTWREFTELLGYWVDLDHPYITYDTQYIETVWYLLQQLYKKGYLYKGKTIQPYSPAAGTGLSTHELNQPGCYRDVSDTSVVAQFALVDAEGAPMLWEGVPVYLLAWTTTPWTLPSNTALAVGEAIEYVYVHSFNAYTQEEGVYILAAARVGAYFSAKGEKAPMAAPKDANSLLAWRAVKRVTGAELLGQRYVPVFAWVKPQGKAYEVIGGDFVSTDDGTGIVHIAPTFGADDARVAREHDIVGMVVPTEHDKEAPLVNARGQLHTLESIDSSFVENAVDREAYAPWAGRYVRAEYTDTEDEDLNVDLCVDLKLRGLAFKIEKFKHSYPHCWRTDKPVLYYPLDAWFVRSTACKERLMELNATIYWKPEGTGVGRFGKWLEGLVDWNLSRSRFWGTPLPIWRSADGKEEICIGSLEELYHECERAVKAGVMPTHPLAGFVVGDYSEQNYAKVDLHRPFVDRIVLVSPTGQPMYREEDLVDVWFDSGAMPYAQWHYPFENKELFAQRFPADFIAEGVDQTRGWFFTLHTLATMLFDSVAFKHIVSNGLVLDKEGNKMSKRLGNALDPFALLEEHGADAVRWYMLTNAQPWENLRFDPAGVEEVVRRFFGTLYNTYSFFALYANVDGWQPRKESLQREERSELDRWVLSCLQSLVEEVQASLNDYDPTRAGRAIQEFVIEQLSNWYVRLNRKRFWGGTMDKDKEAAYQTLYTCLDTLARLMAPLAPFYADHLYHDLHAFTAKHSGVESVHLTDFPTVHTEWLDRGLERRMELAQRFTSMVLALRRKVSIKVRQPLARVMIPVLNEGFAEDMRLIEPILLQEVNVKEVEYLALDNEVIVKRIRPDFRRLGPRAGKDMKALAKALTALNTQEVNQLEATGAIEVKAGSGVYRVELTDVEIVPEDIPGWLVQCDGVNTVALDVRLTPSLRAEGAARELVNRVQNLRRDSGFDVVDRIACSLEGSEEALAAIKEYEAYVQSQVLALEMLYGTLPTGEGWFATEVPLDEPYGTLRVMIKQQAKQ